jgi:hypothetical protein
MVLRVQFHAQAQGVLLPHFAESISRTCSYTADAKSDCCAGTHA